jgi:ABC-2 type transport system ATP-binding protein
LVAAGTTVLLTTQYLEEADRLADRIVVVDRGAVIAEGTAAELKAGLGETVLDLGFVDPEAAERAAALFRGSWSGGVVVDGSLLELSVDSGPSQVMAALRELENAGLGANRMALREPSLDDVFLSLTGRKAETTNDEEES